LQYFISDPNGSTLDSVPALNDAFKAGGGATHASVLLGCAAYEQIGYPHRGLASHACVDQEFQIRKG